MKAYKVEISGSYHGQEKIVDFAKVTGFIPYQDEDVAKQNIIKRYARMWIMGNERYKDRLKKTRECHIDEMSECEHEFSFVGKDIRTLSHEELQDLACAKDLRLIPLYKIGSLRHAQTLAYAAYSDQVLKEKVDYQTVGFNLMKQPRISADGAWRKDTTRKYTNEEVLSQEADRMSAKGAPKSALSREELEQIARTKNVTFHPSISDDNLYKRIYALAS